MRAKPTKGIAVDGSCLGNPGKAEYRGIDIETGEELFRKEIGIATNNIAEFAAICHAFHFKRKYKGKYLHIYTDSVTAISWVRNKKAKTTLEHTKDTDLAIRLIKRCENLLNEMNDNYLSQVQKWDTKEFGENPADFGRK